MGDKWNTSGRSRLRAMQHRAGGFSNRTRSRAAFQQQAAAAAPLNHKNYQEDLAADLEARPTNQVGAHPLLRRNPDSMLTGGYSRAADPIYRRAVGAPPPQRNAESAMDHVLVAHPTRRIRNTMPSVALAQPQPQQQQQQQFIYADPSAAWRGHLAAQVLPSSYHQPDNSLGHVSYNVHPTLAQLQHSMQRSPVNPLLLPIGPPTALDATHYGVAFPNAHSMAPVASNGPNLRYPIHQYPEQVDWISQMSQYQRLRSDLSPGYPSHSSIGPPGAENRQNHSVSTDQFMMPTTHQSTPNRGVSIFQRRTTQTPTALAPVNQLTMLMPEYDLCDAPLENSAIQRLRERRLEREQRSFEHAWAVDEPVLVRSSTDFPNKWYSNAPSSAPMPTSRPSPALISHDTLHPMLSSHPTSLDQLPWTSPHLPGQFSGPSFAIDPAQRRPPHSVPRRGPWSVQSQDNHHSPIATNLHSYSSPPPEFELAARAPDVDSFDATMNYPHSGSAAQDEWEQSAELFDSGDFSKQSPSREMPYPSERGTLSNDIVQRHRSPPQNTGIARFKELGATQQQQHQGGNDIFKKAAPLAATSSVTGRDERRHTNGNARMHSGDHRSLIGSWEIECLQQNQGYHSTTAIRQQFEEHQTPQISPAGAKTCAAEDLDSFCGEQQPGTARPQARIQMFQQPGAVQDIDYDTAMLIDKYAEFSQNDSFSSTSKPISRSNGIPMFTDRSLSSNGHFNPYRIDSQRRMDPPQETANNQRSVLCADRGIAPSVNNPYTQSAQKTTENENSLYRATTKGSGDESLVNKRHLNDVLESNTDFVSHSDRRAAAHASLSMKRARPSTMPERIPLSQIATNVSASTSRQTQKQDTKQRPPALETHLSSVDENMPQQLNDTEGKGKNNINNNPVIQLNDSAESDPVFQTLQFYNDEVQVDSPFRDRSALHSPASAVHNCSAFQANLRPAPQALRKIPDQNNAKEPQPREGHKHRQKEWGPERSSSQQQRTASSHQTCNQTNAQHVGSKQSRNPEGEDSSKQTPTKVVGSKEHYLPKVRKSSSSSSDSSLAGVDWNAVSSLWGGRTKPS